MKLHSLILENFRSYRRKTVIPFSQLTAFIGKNDAGKSTILEALDIFFEGGVIKIEPDDATKDGNPREVRIAAVFSDLPQHLILDSNARTTLEAEHLLNPDGYLEIHKVFNCNAVAPKPKISAYAVHPTNNEAADILQKNQRDLRKIIEEKALQNNCNQAENPSMRQAIYAAIGQLNKSPVHIPLNDENGKAIWTSLQSYLPIFALFQSDRPSSDQDPEVQNPMKVAIAQALGELENELEQVTRQVHIKARETALRTLEKLSESYPDIASTLEPRFKKPGWKNIFKLDLEADDGIPMNKRGSGVRRLVLLSFFQAEAEKRRNENGSSRSVIYAIEEPETSQHPDSQKQIISALRALADAGDQVIITTHVPALAGLIPVKSIRYVDFDYETRTVSVLDGSTDETVYSKVAEALGVLPDPLEQEGIAVAVLVEGKTDIDAIRSMISVLSNAGEIDQIDEQRVFWAIGGGDDTLMDWVERRYLDKLNVPQVMIQDSDRTSPDLPIKAGKENWLHEMQQREGVTAFLTRKRSMDNYFHPATVRRLTNNLVTVPDNVNLDFVKIAPELSEWLTTAKQNARPNEYTFRPQDHDGNLITRTRARECKKIICAYLIKQMTAGELNERATYQSEGGSRNEVREWIQAISIHLE